MANYTDTDFNLHVQNTVYGCILALAVTGNALFLVSITCLMKRRLHLSECLLINLVCCDLLLVIVSIPLQVFEINYEYFPLGKVGCILAYPTATAAMISVAQTLVVLSIERFIATKYPFRYCQLKRYSKFLVLILHLISIAVVVPYAMTLGMHDDQCLETWSSVSVNRSYTIAMFLLQYGLPLPVMIVLYAMVLARVKHSNDLLIHASERSWNHALPVPTHGLRGRLRSYSQTFRSASYKSQLAQNRAKQTVSIFKLFVAIVVIFAVCLLPNQVVWLYEIFSGNSVSTKITTIAYWLTYSNSVLNPVLYGTNPRFRDTYLKLLRPCGVRSAPIDFPDSPQKLHKRSNELNIRNMRAKRNYYQRNAFSFRRSELYQNNIHDGDHRLVYV